MQQQRCHFCGHIVSLVHVHGHYQCPVCNTNALPCCDGDNCDTNVLLQNDTLHAEKNITSRSLESEENKTVTFRPGGG